MVFLVQHTLIQILSLGYEVRAAELVEGARVFWEGRQHVDECVCVRERECVCVYLCVCVCE